jgi:hypothetical protein
MVHRKKVFTAWVIYIVSGLMLFGCLAPPYPQQIQTSVPGLVKTIAVQTMIADPYLIKLVYTPSPTPTWTASPTPTEPAPTMDATETSTPTSVLQSPTSTPITLESPTPSPTSSQTFTPMPTNTPTCSNSADFVRDITIPDGTRLLPGQYFTKIWLVKNTGTCTWKETYSITNFSGESMGMNSPQLLRRITNPGELVEITLDLVAPNTEGTYQGYWILKDENGVSFKSSKEEFFFFWVLIDVHKKSLAEKLGFDNSGSEKYLGGCGEHG